MSPSIAEWRSLVSATLLLDKDAKNNDSDDDGSDVHDASPQLRSATKVPSVGLDHP